MKKKIIGGIFFLFLLSPICLAETIFLKNGKKIQGQIVQQTDKEVKINMRGVILTFDREEIQKIDDATLPQPMVTKEIKPYLPLSEKKETPPSVAESQMPSHSSFVDASLSSMSKEELIVALIEASGAKQNMSQMLAQILTQAPAEEAQKLREVFNIDEIVSHLIPVYEKYFTEDELKGLVSFYQGPLGRKLLMVTPLVMQDSMSASMAYFEEKMQSPEGGP